jgi:hypothetical protein
MRQKLLMAAAALSALLGGNFALESHVWAAPDDGSVAGHRTINVPPRSSQSSGGPKSFQYSSSPRRAVK